MIRLVLYLLGIIILISVVRSVAGVLVKAFATLFEGQNSTVQQRPASAASLGGELKKDPVCGTYISTSTSLKKTVDGAVVYFCSPECRDKFRA